MKYIIKGELEPEELSIWPSDKDAGERDYWLDFTAIDAIDQAACVHLRASQLLLFIEWLETWCPPFSDRK